ncbi:MAG: bifunctional UDP-N-acetylglucosamine diphosphorylase/glucosamine-1-phosphate N-acetyltransferase GlmU [Gammaproteobacteria bacterium]|nr:bifunctional UDP-N-acetylglucosamine diphosphorylase/glucosamine-1-phosphate N-acetyltransferase GlmU [Gammaproteobacteria bacterium]
MPIADNRRDENPHKRAASVPVSAIILAAGQGVRMRSALPKVLHPLGGCTLLEHVHRAATAVDDARVVIVYGHGGGIVPATLAHLDAIWVEQAEQLGTGHAVAQALPAIGEADVALILYGDVPLIGAATLRNLVAAARTTGFGLLSVVLDEPFGYGRVLRDPDGRIRRIVEHKDASPAELAVREVNTGIMAVDAARLRRWIAGLDRNNAQGEYYLTDVVAMAVAEGVEVRALLAAQVAEVMGVNDRVQLADLERRYQLDQAEHLMRAGVTLRDPARLDVRGDLKAGRDVVIDVNVVVEGTVSIGEGTSIGPNVYLRDVEIGPGVVVLANCVLEGAVIGANSRIGPFARVRPDSVLGADVHIGNFVEIKKSIVAERSKINHLAYVGDTDVGTDTNIGAGTITCNYDGAHKHRTVIGNDVFIGSDAQLVAPVTVGDGATIGAGTTLVSDAPAGKLTVGRARQVTVEGWQRPSKQRK